MSSERAAEGVGGVFVNRRMPGCLHSSHTRTAYHSVASQLLGARTSCCSNRPASKGAALLASRQLQLMLKLPLFAHTALSMRGWLVLDDFSALSAKKTHAITFALLPRDTCIPRIFFHQTLPVHFFVCEKSLNFEFEAVSHLSVKSRLQASCLLIFATAPQLA